MDTSLTPSKAATGVPGLDDILSGGFTRGALFLVEGSPGTGKTTLALRYLMEGAARGERALYVTLSETTDELVRGAASHGWTLDSNIEIFELQAPDNLVNAAQHQSLLYSSDLELGETVKRILDAVDRVQPERIVLDSLSEIRLLAQSSLRYRRQLLALKHHFARRNSTVVAIDDLTADVADKTAHSIAHGVVRLEEMIPTYGAERRRMRVMKFRGQPFRGGFHDFTIRTGGLDFVIVGPSSDPARIAGLKEADEAFKKIAEAKASFASRGDDSGTNKEELRLWQAAGIDPKKASGEWYLETGSGMGATLNTAIGKQAYALTDRGTWLSFANKGDFEVLVEGDPKLSNQYGVILVNPAKHPNVKADQGQTFIDWLLSKDGQAAIASFKIDGQQLFFPNAHPSM